MIEKTTILSDISETGERPNRKNIDGFVGDLAIQRITLNTDGWNYAVITGTVSPTSWKPKSVIEETRGHWFAHELGKSADVTTHVRWTKNREKIYLTVEVQFSSVPWEKITNKPGMTLKEAQLIVGDTTENFVNVRHIRRL